MMSVVDRSADMLFSANTIRKTVAALKGKGAVYLGHIADARLTARKFDRASFLRGRTGDECLQLNL
jgi:hypothetical protein